MPPLYLSVGTGSVGDFLSNLVYNYLKTVNVEIAEEFERKYFIQNDAIGKDGKKITLEQVVKKYYDKQNCDIVGDDIIKSELKTAKTGVNLKYSSLLSETLEKYKNINFQNKVLTK